MMWCRDSPWLAINSAILVLLSFITPALCGPQGYYHTDFSVLKRTETTPGGPIFPVACNAPWVSEVLYVGQKPTGARVEISLIGTTGIKVKYTYAAGYRYSDAHLYVGSGPIPTNNGGNPAPGQFPFTVSNGYCTIIDSGKVVECTIPYSDFGYDTSVCYESKYYTVVAHAALVPAPGSGITSGETGWAGTPCIVTGCKPWGKYFTFHFCCPKPEEPPEEPEPEPETPGCETAFGKVNGPPGSSKTFDQLPDSESLPERWGWQNEATCDELKLRVSGNLIAGAGNGVGTYVGTWSAILVNGKINVVYSTADTAWYMEGTHLYVSTSQISKLAPGQYPYKHGSLTSAETDLYSVTWGSQLCSGKVYIVLHADVCKGGAHKD